MESTALQEILDTLEKDWLAPQLYIDLVRSKLEKGRLNNCCLTCKHWIDNYYVLEGYSDKHKMCGISDRDFNGGIMDSICAGEGIGGELVTREDFGCIMHELNYKKDV